MTTLTGKQRLDLAEQFLLRIEAVVDLAAAFGSFQHESPSGPMEEIFEDLLHGDRRGFDLSMHKLFDIADQLGADWKDEEELAHQLARANCLGYVVQFSTPVRHNADENGCSFSWGRSYLQWFYAETIDEVWAMAQTWSEKTNQKAIAANKK